VAGNKSATQPPLLPKGCGGEWKETGRNWCLPPPKGVWRRMERNRQKLVGWDKGGLTEQQTKGTGTTTVQIRRKHNTNCTTHRGALAALPSHMSEFPLPCSPPSQHDGTWYGIPCSVWPGGVTACPAVSLPGFW